MLNDNSNIGIIWPSDLLSSDQVIEYLKSYVEIDSLYKFEPTQGLTEFINDVYFYDLGFKVGSAKSIKNKIKRLISYNNKTAIIIIFQASSFKETEVIRNTVRDKFNTIHEGPAFDIMHCASSKDERDYLFNIISANNIKSYNNRIKLSTNLRNRLIELDTFLATKNISKDKICIVGGAVFDLFNYKFCDDIDIITTDKNRKALGGKGSKKLTDDIDLAKKGYFQHSELSTNLTDTELVLNTDNHIFCQGFKFVNLSYVIERKEISIRPKDKEDLTKLYNAERVYEIEYKNPKDFLHENRYDLICKYLFFKSLLSDDNTLNKTRLEFFYKKHIHGRKRKGEDGGRFIPDQDFKKDINDFVISAKTLLTNMQSNGFDVTFPIPYFDNNIENGAHRIACSLALGLESIPCQKISPIQNTKDWDRKWFVTKKFRSWYIDLLDETYHNLKFGK